MNYINDISHKLVTRNNGSLTKKLSIDFVNDNQISFQLINSNNQLLDWNYSSVYIAGSKKLNKDLENVLFYSTSAEYITSTKILTFKVDSYTENYLKQIKNINTDIFLQIGQVDNSKIYLQDSVVAQPRVYIPGTVPTPISAYYTKEQVDALLNTKLNKNNPNFYNSIDSDIGFYVDDTCLKYGHSLQPFEGFGHKTLNFGILNNTNEYNVDEPIIVIGNGTDQQQTGIQRYNSFEISIRGDLWSAGDFTIKDLNCNYITATYGANLRGLYVTNNITANKNIIAYGTISCSGIIVRNANVFNVNDSGDIVCRNISSDSGVANIFKIVSNNIQNTSVIETKKLINGQHCQTVGNFSHGEGSYAKANGNYSHAEGYQSKANGQYSHVEGGGATANGQYSHAEGHGATANGQYSHAEGSLTYTNSDKSHAEGDSTNTYGNASHAEGYYTIASGDQSHSEGCYTNANGQYSHAEGYYTNANGNNSHSEGYYTNANGNNSHSEGYYTNANGQYSHAEGDSTNANGNSSHAEGLSTVVFGLGAHAQGDSSVAYAAGSHVEGLGTQTWPATNRTYKGGSYSFQHIEGKWNSTLEPDLKAMQYAVGGGSGPTDRKTIYKRDWYGNVWSSGIVSAAHFYDTTLGKIISGGNYLTKNDPTFTGTLKDNTDTFTVDSKFLQYGYDLIDVQSQYNCLIIGQKNTDDTSLNNPVFVIGNGNDEDGRQNSVEIDFYGNIDTIGKIDCYYIDCMQDINAYSINSSTNRFKLNYYGFSTSGYILAKETISTDGDITAKGTISGSRFYDTTTSSYIGADGVTSTYVIDTVSAATSGKADKSQLNSYLQKSDPTFYGNIRSADNRFKVTETSILLGNNLDAPGSEQIKTLVLGDYNDGEIQDKVLVVGNGYYDQEEIQDVRVNSIQIDKTGNIWTEGEIDAHDFRKGSISLVRLNYSNIYSRSAAVALSFLSYDTYYLRFANDSHTNCSFTVSAIRQNTIALIKYYNNVAARTLSFGGNVICAGVGTWLIGLINIDNQVNLVGNPVELK